MSFEKRRQTTLRQNELLVEFAEAHVDLALGRLRSKEARASATRLWRECAFTLNSEGPARSPKKWAKIWNDLKCRVKGKLTAESVARRGTGGGPLHKIQLTELENRVAEIIGRDVGPIMDVAQNQLLSASPAEEDVVRMDEGDEQPQHEQLSLPGPSRLSNPPLETPEAAARASPAADLMATPSPPPSVTSTPHRQQQQRPRPRQRNNRPSRVRPPAETRQTELGESRAMMLRIEEMRARTDNMVARAALIQAEAAKTQADASMLQSQAVATFCQSLLPAMKIFIKRHSRPQTAQLSSDEE